MRLLLPRTTIRYPMNRSRLYKASLDSVRQERNEIAMAGTQVSSETISAMENKIKVLASEQERERAEFERVSE
jgi:hypothetical protein